MMLMSLLVKLELLKIPASEVYCGKIEMRMNKEHKGKEIAEIRSKNPLIKQHGALATTNKITGYAPH